MEKPDFVTDQHLLYLDELRDSGQTNMFGASPFLMEEFCLEKSESRSILSYWMKSFSERHPTYPLT